MHQLFWMKTQSQSKTDHNPHHFPFARDSNTNIWWLAVGEGNWVFSMLYFSWDIFFINFSYWLTYFDFLAVAHWWFSVLVEKKLCLSRIYEELMTHFDIDLFFGGNFWLNASGCCGSFSIKTSHSNGIISFYFQVLKFRGYNLFWLIDFQS